MQLSIASRHFIQWPIGNRLLLIFRHVSNTAKDCIQMFPKSLITYFASKLFYYKIRIEIPFALYENDSF